jgi:multidrug efflux pump subunit AcrB
VIRELPSGAQLRLGDVATVIDGFEDFDITASTDGIPAVMLQIEPSDRLFITKTSKQVNDWIEAKRPDLPQGIEIMSLADMADAYDSRMSLIFRRSVDGAFTGNGYLTADASFHRGALGDSGHCDLLCGRVHILTGG